jgi:hypothetical protein
MGSIKTIDRTPGLKAGSHRFVGFKMNRSDKNEGALLNFLAAFQFMSRLTVMLPRPACPALYSIV